MAATKNLTKVQKEERRARVASLYLQGYTQAEIGLKLDLSQGSVSTIVNEAIDLWRKDSAKAIDQIKAEELARINKMEVECWAAFERSKLPRVIKHGSSASQTEDGGSATNGKGKGRGKKAVEQKVTETVVDGDPRWMQRIERCIEMRLDITGAKAAKKIDINEISKRPIDAVIERTLEILGLSSLLSDPEGEDADLSTGGLGGAAGESPDHTACGEEETTSAGSSEERGASQDT